jgi:hypothetical protein
MKRNKPLALILVTVMLSLLGLATGFVAWADGFGAGVGGLDQTLVVAGLLVVLIGLILWLLVNVLGVSHSEPATSTRRRRSGRARRANAQRSPPLRLAHLHYRLDDPRDPQAFNGFLDQLLLIAQANPADGHYHTPIQLIEQAVVRAVRELEQRHQGRVTVEVKLSRSSLTLGLTFLAAYEFLAQYHDFVESVRLIQQQLRRVIGDASRWYYLLMERELQVETDVAIESSETLAAQRAALEASEAASGAANPPPVSSNTNEVRIHIYPPSLGGSLVNWLILILLTIIFVIVVLMLYCQVGVTGDGCQQIWQRMIA